MTRILVTGSREWYAPSLVHLALTAVEQHAMPWDLPVTLVHGAARGGVDLIADCFARGRPTFAIERHPVLPEEWQRYDKRAGYLRNRKMVDLGADLCLAFIQDWSRGATMTAAMAEGDGIQTYIFRVTTPGARAPGTRADRNRAPREARVPRR